MAGVVDLDPGDYSGTYKLIGGSPALDLANLVSYRGTLRHHDWLEPAANAERWREAVGIDAPAGPGVARLRDFREVVARVFLAIADGAEPPAGEVATIGAQAAKTWARRSLHFPAGAEAAEWADRDPSLLGRVALDAASLLTSPGSLLRIAACGECRWLFLDTSRNNTRRWCDPSDCGNRARQRRHYQRTRAN